jgi:hypothetical protein
VVMPPTAAGGLFTFNKCWTVHSQRLSQSMLFTTSDLRTNAFRTINFRTINSRTCAFITKAFITKAFIMSASP